MSSVKMRQYVERKIARRFISDAITAGYLITVNDGEEDVVVKSQSIKKILDGMFSTDEDRLFLYKEGKEGYLGWVYFIYGNSGWDVISDYTCNLEHVMYGAHKLADIYS